MSNEQPVIGTQTETEDEQIPEFKTVAEAKAELQKTREALKAANAESADRRRKLKVAEDAKTALETAKLSDTEKLQKAHDALKSERDALAQEAQAFKAQQAATAAGALYPDLVASKIPAEALADKRELDKALAQVKAEYPALFTSTHGSANGGAANQGAAGQNMNQLLRRAAGRS